MSLEKWSTRFNGLALTLGGGIVGSSLLAGIVILCVVIGGIAGASVPYAGYIVEKWTLEGVIQTFVAAGIAGEIVGGIAGWFLWRLNRDHRA